MPDLVREAAVPAAAPRVAAREAVATPRAGTGRLRVFVRTAWDQAPIADAEIEVAAGLRTQATAVAPGAALPSAGMVATSLVRARTDAAGVAQFDLPSGLARVRPREYELREPAVATVAAGGETECTVDVPARFTAAVTVVDADQRAVAGARIVGRVPRDRGLVERDLGVTDAAGRWTDAFADPGVTLRAVASGHAASAAAQLLPQSPEARLVLGGAAAILVGSVSGADGAPSGGVALLILPDAAQGRDAAPLTARSDAAGRYRCEHVPPGSCHVVAARATASGQHRITAASAVASAGATTQLDLRFPVGARLVVKFASAAGNVTLVPLHSDLPRALRFHGMAGADPDARGECVVDGLLPGPYEVRLAGAAPQTLDLRDGETRELVVSAARTAWLELEVVDDEQRPLSGWCVAVDPRPGQGAEAEVVIGGAGRVRLEHLAPGAHVVSVASAAGRVPVLVQSVPCNERTRLVVPRRCLVPCRLRGVAVSSGGGPGDGLVVALHRATSAAWRSRSDAEAPVDPVSGSFVCEALPPGGYHVSVLSAQRQLVALRPNVAVDGSEVDLGRIELGTAAIELVVTRDGQPVREPLLAIGIADQPFVPWPRDAARGPGVMQLVAGTHRVLVWGTDIAPTVLDVTARIGEHVTVPVAAPAGTPTTVQCTGVAGGSVLGAVTLRRAGAVLCTLALTDPTGTLRCGLAPGRYRIEFDDGNGQRGASECTVTGTPGPPIQIAVHR